MFLLALLSTFFLVSGLKFDGFFHFSSISSTSSTLSENLSTVVFKSSAVLPLNDSSHFVIAVPESAWSSGIFPHASTSTSLFQSSTSTSTSLFSNSLIGNSWSSWLKDSLFRVMIVSSQPHTSHIFYFDFGKIFVYGETPCIFFSSPKVSHRNMFLKIVRGCVDCCTYYI